MNTSSWPRLLADYQTERRILDRPETIRTRMSYLRRFAQEMPPDATRDQLVAWIGSHGWAPETRKGAQCALRSFYRWAHRAGRMPHDPAADLDPITVPRGLPRPASEAQVEKGRGAACPTRALMVELAALYGLRRSEIAALRREDLTPYGLRVVGKGGKHRMVPVSSSTRATIERRPRGFLFPGRFTGHLHPATVQRWVKAASGVSPHPHRHRFATRAYAGSRDLFAVQRLLGHESAETTQRYVALDMAALEAAVAAAR